MNISSLILTTGLLAIILYYENTEVLPRESTGFESFMSGQSFAVRILFTALGTAITLFWDDYFSWISSTIIHTHLSKQQRPRASKQTVNRNYLLHTSPPTHIFDLSSIYRTMVKTRDWSSLSIAFACFLAKFTPILLSNIPFRNAVTWDMHEVCTWMSVGVLSYMVIVLGTQRIIPFAGPSNRLLKVCCSKRRRNKNAPNEDGPLRGIQLGTGMDNIAGLMYYAQGYYKDMVGAAAARTV